MAETSGWKNKLYFGDNLGILREHVQDGSVDLIYLDPPFNSNATYNVLFGEKSGERSAAQITAFDDTWHWGIESEAAFKELVEKAAVGLFLTLEEPTDPMTKEAATAGFYEPEHFQGRGVPKLQILTVEVLLSGKRLDLPRCAPSATFKKAPRKTKNVNNGEASLWKD